MLTIKLESLEEGMVVATDVKNMDNMLLIPAGCSLTSKHIEVLSAWGISEILVEARDGTEHPGDVLDQIPEEEMERMRSELALRFWESPDSSTVQQEVFRLILRRKALEFVKG
jgi:hypothetical protein